MPEIILSPSDKLFLVECDSGKPICHYGKPCMGKLSLKLVQYGTTEYRAAVSLREAVLQKPLGLSFSEHELALEKDHVHFGAFVGDELIATAVLHPQGTTCKMQRVAVKPEKQKQGFGTKLIAFIEKEAAARGFATIYCSARDAATSFYVKHGYFFEGEDYLEDGVPHIIMRKILVGSIRHARGKDIKEIDQKLGAFNQSMLSFVGESEKPLSYVIRKSGHMIAGISACIDWGHVLYVDLLFVEAEHRNLGLGRILLNMVEREAKIQGAGLVQTDTFDFQAKGFYLKNGYEIFGVLDDCPRPGHKRFYLKKALL